MAATPAQIAELRRKVAEPLTATYSDEALALYIERYPLLDALGNDPFMVSPTLLPPAVVVNTYWAPTYCLNAAAQDIWTEKASALASRFSVTEDGQTFNISDVHKHALEQARYYGSRRAATTVRLWPYPMASTLDQIANGPSGYGY